MIAGVTARYRGLRRRPFSSRLADSYHAKRHELLAHLRHLASTQSGRRRLVERFAAKTVVFTVAAGRSGTQTLSEILSIVPDTTALHEPAPQYRYLLKKCQRDPKLAVRFFLHVKLPAILAVPTTCYAETSHLFCKGFFEPCIALGLRPALVLLRRDTRATALSLLKQQAVPGRTHAGLQYLIAPSDPVYLYPEGFESFSDYQTCYWYCLEIQRRQDLYEEMALTAGLRCARIETQGLNDLGQIRTLLERLGLEVPSDECLETRVGRRYNLKASYGDWVDDLDCDAEEEQVRASLAAHLAGAEPVRARIEHFAAFVD